MSNTNRHLNDDVMLSIVHDDESDLSTIRSQLSNVQKMQFVPSHQFKSLLDTSEQHIIISLINAEDERLNLIETTQHLVHIAIINDISHTSALNEAVSENRLYKYILTPIIKPNMLEEHILAAKQELALRQKRHALLNDISHFSNKLQEIGQHQLDPLTQLPNRHLALDRIKQTLSRAKRRNSLAAVLSIDIDRFSAINHSLGLESGNHLLTCFAQRLSACGRETDTVARNGGDEFLLVLSDIEHCESVIQIIKRIQQALASPFLINKQEVFVSSSIGIGTYPNDAHDAEALVRAANIAMKHAKQLGGNCYQYFEPDMNRRIRKLMDMECNLFRALERNEFIMHYQPQIDLASGKVVGAEALIRWQRPGHGIVSPNEFIPILENTGLIKQVGEWILNDVTAQSRKWQEEGLPPLRTSINLSLRQVQDNSIIEHVASLIDKLDHLKDPKLPIELEITESIMMKNTDQSISLLLELNKMGVHLSIDDFGTGYASLNHLTRFPVHGLKIDLSFIQRIETGAKDAAIVKAIILMAHSLGLRVTAEGVETQKQLDFLYECQCDEIQGYLFSKPLPANEFADLIRSGKKLSRPEAELA